MTAARNRRRWWTGVSYFVLMSGLASGCAPSGSVAPGALSPSATAGPDIFFRDITSIAVFDSAGRRIEHPFLGGFNVPRPQLIDIDDDGDLDLFLQEKSGQLMFFERRDDGDGIHYLWTTDHYEGLDIGEWFRFADLDGDGDYDLLAEQPFSYIRYYRNEGSRSSARFVAAVDTLKDVDGTPLFSDRQNIPNVTDIDCDGRLDLFIGQLTGTVTRYEEAARTPGNIPLFRLVTRRFENIEIVARIGSRHGANTLAFADFDGDGDEDLFWGDFFEQGLLLIENTGSCSNPVLRGEPRPFPIDDPLKSSGYNAPAFGDINDDGILDFVVGVLGGAYNPNLTIAQNLFYYEGAGDGDFSLLTHMFLRQLDVGSESVVTFGDLDGDRDLDMLVANKIDPANQRTSRIYRFENTGSDRKPEFTYAGPLDLTGAYHYVPALGDLDQDGDLDMLLGKWDARIAFYRNTGSDTEPQFELEDSSLVRITRGSNTTPVLVDIDGDSDLDLFAGEASGTINFYRNTGTSREPVFELVSDRYLDIDVGRRSFPTFVDIDRDGDMDMVIGREAGGALLYRNQGSPSDPDFVLDSDFQVPLDGYSTPVFVDIDADGDMDLFSGGAGGGITFLKNRRIDR